MPAWLSVSLRVNVYRGFNVPRVRYWIDRPICVGLLRRCHRPVFQPPLPSVSHTGGDRAAVRNLRLFFIERSRGEISRNDTSALRPGLELVSLIGACFEMPQPHADSSAAKLTVVSKEYLQAPQFQACRTRRSSTCSDHSGANSASPHWAHSTTGNERVYLPRVSLGYIERSSPKRFSATLRRRRFVVSLSVELQIRNFKKT